MILKVIYNINYAINFHLFANKIIKPIWRERCLRCEKIPVCQSSCDNENMIRPKLLVLSRWCQWTGCKTVG